MSIDVSGIKEGQKMMWTIGDYPDIAQRIESAAAMVVERVDLSPGVSLLDVATGTGNVAMLAAGAGAGVTGLDITPRLLEVARSRASDAGADAEFIEGDAEQLPFEDGSFDRVTSCFGVMFAPRQKLAASELVRVARAGGRIVIAAWTPEGINGQMLKTVGSYLPAPPPELDPPIMWGNEAHVRSLLGNSGAEISFERHQVTFEHESAQGWFDYNERVLGPTIMAKAALEPQGKWDSLRGELLKLYTDANEAGDGSFRMQAEYLITVAQLPA